MMDERKETLSDRKARLASASSHGGREEKRPLIEQVTNQWHTLQDDNDDRPHLHTAQSKREDFDLSFCDLDEPSSCPNTTRDLVSSRRFRRMLAFVVVFTMILYYTYARLIKPRLAEEWAYREGFVSQENGTYGIARGGDVDKDMTHMKTLDLTLLPGGPSDSHGKKRLIFIGDVHGCKKELNHLLKKVDFQEYSDHLILTGDTVSKGPDNIGVLDELIRLNATSVRGNHEDRLIHVAKKLRIKGVETSGSKGFSKDAAIVRQLNPHHLQYLHDMPLMLHIPTLPMASGSSRKSDSPITEHILVVHAGLVPGVRLKKQDPYFVMNMRSINRRTHVPSALRDAKNSKPWYDIWCWYNDRIFRRRPMAGFNRGSDGGGETSSPQEQKSPWIGDWWKDFFGKKAHPKPEVVIYGHDSHAGLQINRWSKGLDSGCVSGGRLTALVLDAKGRQEVVSVRCENYKG